MACNEVKVLELPQLYHIVKHDDNKNKQRNFVVVDSFFATYQVIRKFHGGLPTFLTSRLR